MPTARVVAVAPGSPAAVGGPARRRRAPQRQRRSGARRHPLPAAVRRTARRARAPTRWSGAPGRRRQGRRANRSASGWRARCSTGSAPATTTARSASSTSCRPGMRPSLSVKDDDYRLSFLYGNFTTLTRFTEADLERVVTERLGPLYVSIHATDPDLRARLLRNRRGATSLRWLGALLDAGHRGARPGRGVPGHQRRSALSTTPCSGSSTGSRRSRRSASSRSV